MALAATFFPTDLLSDSLMMCDPLFTELQRHEPIVFGDVSPPESPCYSTTLSDTSGDEFVDMLSSPGEFRTPSEVMLCSSGSDLFGGAMASPATWVPESVDDSDFGAIVQFSVDDSIVIGDLSGMFDASKTVPVTPAVPLIDTKPIIHQHVPQQVVEPVVEEQPASPKRKASCDDARPAKKARCSPAPVDLSVLPRDDPEAKRHTHNILERRRRNDLKNSYQQLRMNIPSLEDNERAPTGQILIHAVECISALKAEDERLMAEIAAARAENERLRAAMA